MNLPPVDPKLVVAGFVILGVPATSYAWYKVGLKQEGDFEVREALPAIGSSLLTVGGVVLLVRGYRKEALAMTVANGLLEDVVTDLRKSATSALTRGKDEDLRAERGARVLERNKHREIERDDRPEGLVIDAYTQRVFRADAEQIRYAANEFNRQLLNHGYMPLNEFHELLGLDPAPIGHEVGWNIDNPIEVKFATILGKEMAPMLVLDYNPPSTKWRV